MSRVAVLKGGNSLERQVSLRSGARVQDALERLGHDVVAIDVGPDLVADLERARPDVAFVALHGTDGEDGTVQELLEVMGIPYTGSGVSACIRAADKVLAKHAMRDHGLPTPDFYAFNQTAFETLGAGQALPAIEDRLAFPIVVKPARQGSALGIKFARTAADVPAALVAAFSYDRKVLLERYVDGRELAVSVLDAGRRAAGAADRRGRARAGLLLRLRLALRDRPHPIRVPGAAARRRSPRAPTRSPCEAYRLLGCRGFARVDLMLDGDDALFVLEVNPIPGPDRDEPAAPGRRGGGDQLRRARRADPRRGRRPRASA